MCVACASVSCAIQPTKEVDSRLHLTYVVDDAIVVRGVTLDVLLALADAKLGSRKAVMKTLSVSRQRLYSAAHGGPPLRAERLIRLSLVTGVDVGEALRAGGQHRLADLLDEAYEFRLGDTTPTQRALLRTFGRLPVGTQQLFTRFMEGLAEQQEHEAGV